MQHETRSDEGRKEGRRTECGARGKRKEGREGGRRSSHVTLQTNVEEGKKELLSLSFSGQSSSLDCVLKRGARASERNAAIINTSTGLVRGQEARGAIQ